MGTSWWMLLKAHFCILHMILFLASTFCRVIGSLPISYQETLKNGISVSEGSLQADLKLKMVKSLFGSWTAFQKISSGHVATTIEQEFEQGVVDLVAVNMLLQTLEQLRQTVASCGMSMDDPQLDPQNLYQRVTQLRSSLGQLGTAGRFEWVDGGLLKAIERGEWVVLENANFCNPTVRHSPIHLRT